MNKKIYQYQSGAVFLLFITVLVLASTVLVVGKLSINQQKHALFDKTTQKLQLARDALLGYALNQPILGVLPCPDTTGDGDANMSAGGCVQTKGWLPFRTLGLDDLRDSAGEKFWYVLDPSYAIGAVPFNSSSISLLENNGESLVFAVLAPNQVLDGQVRSSTIPSPSHYLEGVNSDADPYTVAYHNDADNNDQLLTYSLSTFWTLVENSIVIPAAREALNQYYLACGTYPWAAAFAQTSFGSVVGLQQGGLPSQSSLPSDGSACSHNLSLPHWLQDHWADHLQYQFCLSSEGQCLAVIAGETPLASAALIAPGTPLTGQNRMTGALVDYFENDNASTSTIVEVRNSRNHDMSFNDVTIYLP